jgi:DeoR family lactose phosphotransferase system repressor
MKKDERQELLIKEIKLKDIVTVKQFFIVASEHAIPEITARRDLAELERKGRIKVEFGKVTLFDPTNEEPLDARVIANVKEKAEIANIATHYIEENDSVYVSPDSTNEYLIRQITKPVKLIVTNGLGIFEEALKNENIQQIRLVGGRYRKKSKSFVGGDAMEIIEKYDFDKAFFSANNISDEGMLYNNHDYEALMFQDVLTRTKKSFVLLDYTKFNNNNGTSRIVNIEQIDLLITNEEAKPLISKTIQANVNIVTK